MTPWSLSELVSRLILITETRHLESLFTFLHSIRSMSGHLAEAQLSAGDQALSSHRCLNLPTQ